MDGVSADHAGAVICRHAGEFDVDGRTRPHDGLRQRPPELVARLCENQLFNHASSPQIT